MTDLDLGTPTTDSDLDANDIPPLKEAKPHAAPDVPKAKKSKSRATTGKPVKSSAESASRTLVRQVAAKTVELVEADAEHRKLAATMLGVNDDPVDMATAVYTSKRSGPSAVSDLFAAADAESFEAAVTVMSFGRQRIKALWQLLRSLGEVSGDLNSSDTKAAVAIARAAQDLNGDVRRTAEAAAELVKRA